MRPAARLTAKLAQGRHRSRLRNAHAGGHLANAVNRTIPNYVFYVNVVAEEKLAVVVYVDNSHEARLSQSEIVEERRVLAEGAIGVRGIVTWRLVVAEKDYYTAADKALQLVAAAQICLFAEHC